MSRFSFNPATKQIIDEQTRTTVCRVYDKTELGFSGKYGDAERYGDQIVNSLNETSGRLFEVHKLMSAGFSIFSLSADEKTIKRCTKGQHSHGWAVHKSFNTKKEARSEMQALLTQSRNLEYRY